MAVHCDSGDFVWVSKAYPGATAETEIVRKELEAALVDGEKLLADRLFSSGPYITALPYDCERTRRVNSVRSKVERKISEIKNFSIFRQSYRSTDYLVHENIFHLICRFINIINKNKIKI